MKILIDLTSLADNFSGIERYALNISLQLIKNENHKFVLCFKEKVFPEFENFSAQSNVEFVVIKKCNKLMFYQFRLPAVLRKYKVDYYLFLAFPVPLLFRKKNIIATVHDLCCWDCPETMTAKSRAYFKAGIKHSVKISKKIITVSEFSKSRIIEKFHCDNEKVVVCYDGVEEKFLKYGQLKHHNDEIVKKYKLPDKYILSLSTLEPRKNIKLLLKAYDCLVKENNDIHELVLAGRAGWKINDLMEGIDEVTKAKIHFTGFIDDSDLPDVYGFAKFFVFPSKYEGFGLPPLEALACGVLVVSSDAASLPEVLDDSAIYFENENCESLKNAMQSAFSISQKESNQLIENGILQANKFLWSEEAEKILNSLILM